MLGQIMNDDFFLIEECLWKAETITKLRKRLKNDFNAGFFNRDFEDKLAARRIPMSTVRHIINSRNSYIVKYYDRFDGTRRLGLWHPSNPYFLAWKPGRRSQFKTCFYHSRARIPQLLNRSQTNLFTRRWPK